MSPDRVAHLTERLGGRIGYGGDYNPEQWPEEVWAQDVELMRAAHVTMVTLPVFGWSRLQPAPDQYDFGWLDRVLDLLHEGGIAVDLATATASPPPWLTARHPEILPVDRDGVRLAPGSRQHYCPSSEIFRAACVEQARQMAARYGEHPALALWHPHNEYSVHVAECHCEVSAEHFRRWLAERYGDVETLNATWGTAVWSQRYSAFAEVQTPRRMAYTPNPGHVLDWRRFCSDALLELYVAERDVLREATPHIPVTTNVITTGRPLDLWRWSAEQDVVCHDGYPDPTLPDAAVDVALAADLLRGLRGGQPWMLMEQAPGAVDWRTRNVAKPPGVMRLWSLQSVARGADAILFFQWRQARRGAEQFHSGMVPAGGADTRVHREVAELGRELADLSDVVGTRVDAEVALVVDWQSGWAMEDLPRPAHDFRMLPQIRAHHAALWSLNVAIDIVAPDADLSRYRVVAVPSLFALSDAAAANLGGFDGELVIGPFSGINDETNAIRLGPHPAAFAARLGLRVEDFAPPHPDERLGLVRPDASPAGTGEEWAEWVVCDGAEPVLSFADGELAGWPAAARGDRSLYLSTRPDPALLRALYADVLDRAGVVPVVAGLPEGVEAVRRGPRLFLLNHATTPARVVVGDATVELGPRDVVVLDAAGAARRA